MVKRMAGILGLDKRGLCIVANGWYGVLFYEEWQAVWLGPKLLSQRRILRGLLRVGHPPRFRSPNHEHRRLLHRRHQIRPSQRQRVIQNQNRPL